MRKILLFFLFFYAYSVQAQNCFNEYDNVVSSLACVDATASFEINYQAAIIENPNQPHFVSFENNVNTPIPCWYMMNRSGPFFNIHQYGLYKGNLDFIITYKIIKRYSIGELAITISGKPFFHKTIDIYTDPKTDWHDFEGTGNLLGNDIKFAITMEDSNIIGVTIGSATFVIRKS